MASRRTSPGTNVSPAPASSGCPNSASFCRAIMSARSAVIVGCPSVVPGDVVASHTSNLILFPEHPEITRAIPKAMTVLRLRRSRLKWRIGRIVPRAVLAESVRIVEGSPDESKINTSYIERSNLTMRMGKRRFTRLTNAFSKKVENPAAVIALRLVHYNFARPHKTLGRGSSPRSPRASPIIAGRSTRSPSFSNQTDPLPGRPGLARRRARCQNAATHERHEPFRTALSLLLLRLAGRVVYLSVSFT